MSKSTLSRRDALVKTGAFGLAMLAPSVALGDADDPKNPVKGTQVASVEKAHPAGSEALDGGAKLDPRAAKLAQLLRSKARHAFALAAANPTTTFAPGSLHAIAKNAVGTLSTKRQARAKTKATAMLSAADVATTFGGYSKATLASATVTQAPDVDLTAVVREMTNAEKDKQKQAEKDGNKEGNDPVYKSLMYQLNSIKCVEKQDSSAHDELLISGYLFERDGTISKIDRIKYENWSSGDKRYFDYEACTTLGKPMCDALGLGPHGSADDVYRGRKLIECKIGGPGTWGFILVLGEQDSGGFNSFLSDMYKSLKSEIDAAVKLVLQGVGDAVGGLLSAYIGPLGELLGQALGWALGELYGWICSLVGDSQDDPLGAITWQTTLTSRKQSWVKNLVGSDALPSPAGTCASSMKKSSFKKQGGHYEVRWHWRAYA